MFCHYMPTSIQWFFFDFWDFCYPLSLLFQLYEMFSAKQITEFFWQFFVVTTFWPKNSTCIELQQKFISRLVVRRKQQWENRRDVCLWLLNKPTMMQWKERNGTRRLRHLNKTSITTVGCQRISISLFSSISKELCISNFCLKVKKSTVGIIL